MYLTTIVNKMPEILKNTYQRNHENIHYLNFSSDTCIHLTIYSREEKVKFT